MRITRVTTAVIEADYDGTGFGLDLEATRRYARPGEPFVDEPS